MIAVNMSASYPRYDSLKSLALPLALIPTLGQVQAQLLGLYNNTNALYPGTFPAVRKFEAEIIAMTIDLLHAQGAQ